MSRNADTGQLNAFEDCHALRGRVSRNVCLTKTALRGFGHALRGRVSRNEMVEKVDGLEGGHALRGRVSRNALLHLY